RIGSARVVRAAGPERLDARTREARERWRLGQLSGRAARRLGSAGASAWVGPDRVVWFEPDSTEPRITADWIERASGGLVAGGLRLVFVAPFGAPKKARNRWRRHVTTLDVRAAIGGERVRRRPASLLRIALLRA